MRTTLSQVLWTFIYDILNQAYDWACVCSSFLLMMTTAIILDWIVSVHGTD